MATPLTARHTPQNSLWLHIFAGLCASLVSIGLARFAYTPLIPPLIQAHWFAQADVVYLGAANLGGYLIGALLGHPLGKRFSNPWVLRLMLVVATLSFFACAFPLSLLWFFAWRLLSGIAGGSIMVLVASTVLPHVPVARRGMASGAIFLGVGLGIAGSGTLVPALLHWGLQDTWIGLGLVSAVLTAASWFGWPPQVMQPGPALANSASATAKDLGQLADKASTRSLRLLFAQYALMATGLVPAMVFLVDYVTRGLGGSTQMAALVWVMYGVGAILGPVVYGALADRLGAQPSIRWVLAVQAVAVGLLSLVQTPWLLCTLAVLIGSFPPGIVPLALARIHELNKHAHAQQVAWSRATVAFASFQALAGLAYSLIFNATAGHYHVLFIIACGALLLALLLELVTQRLAPAVSIVISTDIPGRNRSNQR